MEQSDIEEGAGDADNAGVNLVHFVNKLRTLQPEIIIGQPTYGYPQGDKILNFTKFSTDCREQCFVQPSMHIIRIKQFFLDF